MSNGGFSKARLGRLHDALARLVESGAMPGLVALVWRRGETHVETIGSLGFDNDAPMRRDTIFRIASVTKPIVAAAAMSLVEECRIRLDDPVDDLLPELANRRVLRTLGSEIDDVVPANRAITLRDLLTFRLGYGAVMAFPPQYPIQRAMEQAGVAPGPQGPSVPPDALMAAYGGLPLVHQPGEQWLYNSGSDILGVLMARATGKGLGEILHERILDPLGMKDTAFSLPTEKLDRLPDSYWTNFETGEFGIFDPAKGSQYGRPPIFESGAGGLVSTVDDLLAFGQMMLGLGRFAGQRILARPTVEVMTTDQITPAQKAASTFFPEFWVSHGWGFGVSVVTKRDDVFSTPGRYGWDGGYGTSWYVDPQEALIGVLMTQRLMDSPVAPAVFRDFWTSAYQAIDD
ncbi:MAG TPA: serine hydrolase domain-containing protein [Thermomicrobiales bacterium]|nr:serine hydrolase domain-containing protein [Thermomicrobiales bacterium]